MCFVEEELEPVVETKAIAEQEAPAVSPAAVTDEPIATGGQIMHQKFMVADAGTDGAAVWMGSANFHGRSRGGSAAIPELNLSPSLPITQPAAPIDRDKPSQVSTC
jgi:hypothetical protein